MRYKLVHLQKPEVVSVHDSKEKAEHACAMKRLKFQLRKKKKGPFPYGVVPFYAVFKVTKCMGPVWT